MITSNALELLTNGKSVIPAVRNEEDFNFALQDPRITSLILLYGDINTLPGMLAKAKRAQKVVIVHTEMLGGLGGDKAAVAFLAKAGVKALITTKSHLGKAAQESGMFVIQRMFLMDSASLRSGIHLLRNFKPDAIEILPASVPAWVVEQFTKETGIPVIAGGLMRFRIDVERALRNGIRCISVSNRELWDM